MLSKQATGPVILQCWSLLDRGDLGGRVPGAPPSEAWPFSLSGDSSCQEMAISRCLRAGGAAGPARPEGRDRANGRKLHREISSRLEEARLPVGAGQPWPAQSVTEAVSSLSPEVCEQRLGLSREGSCCGGFYPPAASRAVAAPASF